MGSWSYVHFYPDPAGFRLQEMVAFLIKQGCEVEGNAPYWLKDLMAGKAKFEDFEEPDFSEFEDFDSTEEPASRTIHDVTFQFEARWFVAGFGRGQLRMIGMRWPGKKAR